jgi:aryl-alcohol dehydrogenase-like predicted oxidoreductase
MVPIRTLGDGLQVSAIGFGAMVIAPGIYGEVDDRESLATLRRSIDLGVTFIDTADVYGMGHSERLVGQAVEGRRDEVTIATKFGSGGGTGLGRPEYVHKAIDRSLKNLSTDHVDLYYLYRVDPTTPIAVTVGAMAELVEAGKVRHIGLSEAAPETIRRGQREHPIAALQTEYSLLSRDPEREVLPLLRELGIGFVAYSPLGRGLLGGNIQTEADIRPEDWRRRTVPRFQGENLDRNVGIVTQLGEIAAARGLTVAQLALAWLLHQGPDVVPIPGTRKIANLELNASSASVDLSADELARIADLVAPQAVAGERADAGYLARVGI